jgi:hypothetical protein
LETAILVVEQVPSVRKEATYIFHFLYSRQRLFGAQITVPDSVEKPAAYPHSVEVWIMNKRK